MNNKQTALTAEETFEKYRSIGCNCINCKEVKPAVLKMLQIYSDQQTSSLIEENKRLRETIQRALNISDLWTCNASIHPQHDSECQALQSMYDEFKQAIRKEETNG